MAQDTKTMRILKFYGVGLVVLYFLYYVESWLETQYAVLTTTSVLGFIVIGVITLTVIAYLSKKLNGNQVV